ncbi:hypothetical protein [Streptomyces malaysiensis]|uniref:hypothetical protein n=1 Tax=Streptomyces malaysiensis TaxID=92644 RepID=UPI002B2FE498|nr:hypothetical protein R8789_02445 [Streptomyces malaysiensis]
MFQLASKMPPKSRWAMHGALGWITESAASAGLAAFLEDAGERVIEVCRFKRPPARGARGGRKTDMLDAIRATREARATEHVIQSRRRG